MSSLQWLKLTVKQQTGATAQTVHKNYGNEIALTIQEYGEKLIPPINVDLSTIITKYVNTSEPYFRLRTESPLITAVVDGGQFEVKTMDSKVTYALLPTLWDGDTTTGRVAANKKVWGFLNSSNPNATLTPAEGRLRLHGRSPSPRRALTC